MRTYEDLFETVQKDRHRQTVTRYGYLHLGALLRKLLLDSTPLIHHANRRVKMTFVFHVHASDPKMVERHRLQGSGILTMKDALFPGTEPTPVLELPLPQFLAHKVAIVDQTDVSIREIIKYVANVEGGVHWGHGGTKAEQGLAQFTPALIRARLTDEFTEAQLAGASSVGPIMGIAKVVANDLFELYLRLARQRADGSQMLMRTMMPIFEADEREAATP